MKKGNFILGLHPFTNLLGIVSIILSALILNQTRYFYLGFIIFLLVASLSDKLEVFLKTFFIFIFPIGILIGLLILLVMDGEVAFSFLFIDITREGLTRANILLSRLFLIMGGIILFFNIINIKDLLLSLESKGVSRSQTFAILSMVQIFDEFNRNIVKFINVSKTRGVRIEGNIFERGRMLVPMILPIYKVSRKTIENNLLLMETRGFSLDSRREEEKEILYNRRDKFLKKIFYILPLVVYIWRISR